MNVIVSVLSGMAAVYPDGSAKDAEVVTMKAGEGRPIELQMGVDDRTAPAVGQSGGASGEVLLTCYDAALFRFYRGTEFVEAVIDGAVRVKLTNTNKITVAVYPIAPEQFEEEEPQ